MQVNLISITSGYLRARVLCQEAGFGQYCQLIPTYLNSLAGVKKKKRKTWPWITWSISCLEISCACNVFLRHYNLWDISPFWKSGGSCAWVLTVSHRNMVHIHKLSRVHPQVLFLSEAVAMKIHVEGLDNFTITILSHLWAAWFSYTESISCIKATVQSAV